MVSQKSCIIFKKSEKHYHASNHFLIITEPEKETPPHVRKFQWLTKFSILSESLILHNPPFVPVVKTSVKFYSSCVNSWRTSRIIHNLAKPDILLNATMSFEPFQMY